jgi:hypothetical protein
VSEGCVNRQGVLVSYKQTVQQYLSAYLALLQRRVTNRD